MKRKSGFLLFIWGGGCQYVLMQTGLGNWHPLFFNYYITNELHLKNYCVTNKYDSNSLKFVLFVQQLNKMHVNLIEYNIS